jgi:hypothetical protein
MRENLDEAFQVHCIRLEHFSTWNFPSFCHVFTGRVGHGKWGNPKSPAIKQHPKPWPFPKQMHLEQLDGRGLLQPSPERGNLCAMHPEYSGWAASHKQLVNNFAFPAGVRFFDKFLEVLLDRQTSF